MYDWLDGGLGVANKPNACFNFQGTLTNLKTLIDNQERESNTTAEPRKLSDAEMNFYSNYNEGKLIFYERGRKTGILHSFGGKRNNFDSNICWELPTSGAGFVVYNRDDLKDVADLKDKKGLDQIGTKETIDAMINIAKEWRVSHADRLLQYGDISRPGGINTPDHGTHNNGKVFDVRPLRNDSQVGDSAKLTYNDSSYDLGLTKEFILLIRRLYPGTKFYFNDSKIYGNREFSSFVTKMGGHDNHLHVIFPGGN